MGSNPISFVDPLGLELSQDQKTMIRTMSENTMTAVGTILGGGGGGLAAGALGIPTGPGEGVIVPAGIAVGAVAGAASGKAAGSMMAEGIIAMANAASGGGGGGQSCPLKTWKPGHNHSDQQWDNRYKKGGWTDQQISETLNTGQPTPAPNLVNPGNPATTYLNPATGKWIVYDEATGEVLQVSAPGYVPKIIP